jgi:hypothetical protein
VATTSTYTPTATDFDGSHDVSIRVEVTSTKTGYTPATADSPAYAMELGTMTFVKAAKLTSTVSQFSITPAITSPATPTLSSHWFTNGVNDQDTLNYDRDASAGDSVYAQVTYILAGYNNLVAPKLVAQIGNAPVTTTPTISGTPTYGHTLSTTTTVSDVFTYPDTDLSPGAVLSYKWYSGTTAISGATASTYKPSSSYIGKHISVKVTATSPYYATASATSAAVTFAGGSFGSPDDPTISSGTVQPGAVLTAVPDTVDYGTTSITFTYKWERSTDSGVTWTAISGGTHSTYVPVATDVNDELRVLVTATKSHYTTLTLDSDPVTVQYSPTLATLTPPTLTGTGQVGDPLTLSTGVWNTPTLTYTYQWFVDDAAVPGVTGSTYTPRASEVGDLVTAKVTAHRSGWLPQTVTSNLVVVADADAPVNTIAPTISETVPESGPVWTVTNSGAWNVDGLTYSYQWFVGTTAQSNAGANTNSWSLQGVSGSGEITVQITATRTGYAPKTITVDTGHSI